MKTDAQRRAHAAYMRSYRAGARGGDPRNRLRTRVDVNRLEVLCWCEATVVHVTAEDVRAGRTGTCGSDTCRAAS